MSSPLPSSSLRYLIGGNPCGATRFLASYLTLAGVPASHEGFYCSDGALLSNPGGVIYRDGKLVAKGAARPVVDVSYTVVEWMDHPDVAHLPVICLLRNPFHVLNSLLRVALYNGVVVDPDALMKIVLTRYQKLLDSPRLLFKLRVEHDLGRLSQLGAKFFYDTERVWRNPHNEGRINLEPAALSKYPSFERFQDFTWEQGYL